jgi:hypothetical protein
MTYDMLLAVVAGKHGWHTEVALIRNFFITSRTRSLSRACQEEFMKAARTRLLLFFVLGSVLVGCVQIRQPDFTPDVAAPAFVSLGAGPVLFSDGFESGTFQSWTSVSGLVLQQTIAEGSWAARGTMAGSGASAYVSLAPQQELTASVRMQLVSISGTSAVNFLKLRTATGTALAEVYVTASGLLGLRNDVTAVATNSTSSLPLGSWQRWRCGQWWQAARVCSS